MASNMAAKSIFHSKRICIAFISILMCSQLDKPYGILTNIRQKTSSTKNLFGIFCKWSLKGGNYIKKEGNPLITAYITQLSSKYKTYEMCPRKGIKYMSSPSFTFSKNISDIRGSIVIKFHIKHYHVGEKAVKGFLADWIGTLVTMATLHSYRFIIGKSKINLLL